MQAARRDVIGQPHELPAEPTGYIVAKGALGRIGREVFRRLAVYKLGHGDDLAEWPAFGWFKRCLDRLGVEPGGTTFGQHPAFADEPVVGVFAARSPPID